MTILINSNYTKIYIIRYFKLYVYQSQIYSMGTILRKYIETRTWIADTCYHLESAFMKAWKLNICKTNSESDILLLYFLPQFLSLTYTWYVLDDANRLLLQK